METISALKAFGALGLVLGLIAVAALLVRHFKVNGAGWRRDDKRLGVVEQLTLDARRRVLLIRHDNAEHLVLLGNNSEIVLGARTEAPRGAPPSAPTETHTPGPPAYRSPSQRVPYRRDEPTLGPVPPRSR